MPAAKKPAAKKPAAKQPAPAPKPYAIHPGVAMQQKVIANLKAKTGRSLEEWIPFIEKHAPAETRDRAAWLKSEHGLGTNYALFLALAARGHDFSYDPDGYVEKLFSGKKEPLRPLFERLLAEAYSLGADVTATPCSTMVPLRRKFVFAQIKPTTNTRIDLGLALADTPIEAPLIDTGGFEKKDRITRRIPITCEEDITPEVLAWLRRAYDATPA